MSWFTDLWRGRSGSSRNPMYDWGVQGKGVTMNYLKALKEQAKVSRKGTLESMKGAYKDRKGALTTKFDEAMRQAKKEAVQTATARGFGSTTMSLGLGATGRLAAARESALGDLTAQYREAKSSVAPSASPYFNFMIKKAKHGALEPWELMRMAPPNPQGQARGEMFRGAIGSALGGGNWLGDLLGGIF